MMWEHVLLGSIGFCGGVVIAGGLVALLMELKIIPRYAGITHTANRILIYENCIVGGAVLGNLITIFQMEVFLGHWFLWMLGLFGGIFIGSWIIALTEVLDIIPIMARRAGIKKGFTILILAIAFGKAIASLLFSYYRW